MSPRPFVRIEARAKLNLGLAVGARRPDGFHELATIFQSVSLADTLEARPARDFRLALRHERAALRGEPPRAARTTVPAGEENLALRAARLGIEAAGLRGGVHLRLTKRIPARSGLGGGSADAAAALAAVFALHGVRMGLEDRLALAARLGSDVPFALFGGTALGTGRGERLVRLRPPHPFRALIAVPSWTISTSRAFARLRRSSLVLTRPDPKLRFAKVAKCKGLWPDDAIRLGNSFEEVLGPQGLQRRFESLRARLREAGVREPVMTGSGSAVFGILGPGVSERAILGRFVGSEALYVVRSVSSGLRIERQSRRPG